jgi:hypothetical protein
VNISGFTEANLKNQTLHGLKPVAIISKVKVQGHQHFVKNVNMNFLLLYWWTQPELGWPVFGQNFEK